MKHHHAMEKYERLQALLELLKTHFCGGVTAKLAKRIEKDSSYVGRLFYPAGKAGAKGIGPDVMEACTQHLDLPRGFWEMEVEEARLAIGVVADAAPAAQEQEDDIVINQYVGVGGGMGRSKLVLSEQPGVIKSWHVNHEWLRLNVKNYTAVENLKIVTGFGHSMRPMFNPGDPLLIDVGIDRVDQEGVFFFRVGDDGFIKSLQRIPQPGGGRILKAKSRNTEEFEDFLIDEATMDFQVLAKVLTVWSSNQY